MLAAPPIKVSIAVLAGLALTGALAGCSAAEDAARLAKRRSDVSKCFIIS